jgi:hypothetical protein
MIVETYTIVGYYRSKWTVNNSSQFFIEKIQI